MWSAAVLTLDFWRLGDGLRFAGVLGFLEVTDGLARGFGVSLVGLRGGYGVIRVGWRFGGLRGYGWLGASRRGQLLAVAQKGWLGER